MLRKILAIAILTFAIHAVTANAAIGTTDYELHAYTPNLYGGFTPTFYPSGSIDQIISSDRDTAWIQSETCLKYENYPGEGGTNIECSVKPSQFTTRQATPPPIMLYADPHNCEWIFTWQWGAVYWTGGWQTKAISSAAIRLC